MNNNKTQIMTSSHYYQTSIQNLYDPNPNPPNHWNPAAVVRKYSSHNELGGTTTTGGRVSESSTCISSITGHSAFNTNDDSNSCVSSERSHVSELTLEEMTNTHSNSKQEYVFDDDDDPLNTTRDTGRHSRTNTESHNEYPSPTHEEGNVLYDEDLHYTHSKKGKKKMKRFWKSVMKKLRRKGKKHGVVEETTISNSRSNSDVSEECHDLEDDKSASFSISPNHTNNIDAVSRTMKNTLRIDTPSPPPPPPISCDDLTPVSSNKSTMSESSSFLLDELNPFACPGLEDSPALVKSRKEPYHQDMMMIVETNEENNEVEVSPRSMGTRKSLKCDSTSYESGCQVSIHQSQSGNLNPKKKLSKKKRKKSKKRDKKEAVLEGDVTTMKKKNKKRFLPRLKPKKPKFDTTRCGDLV